MDRPTLIVLGGAPGAGKTVLAKRLSEALELPLLSKDAIKEPLMETLGVANIEENRRIGVAAYRVLFGAALALLTSGCGLILESNFWVGQSEAELAPLLALARGLQITCACDEDVRRARYEARAREGLRHPGHLDEKYLAEWNTDRRRLNGRLALEIPHLVVDTTHGYQPTLGDVVQFCRTQSGDHLV